MDPVLSQVWHREVRDPWGPFCNRVMTQYRPGSHDAVMGTIWKSWICSCVFGLQFCYVVTPSNLRGLIFSNVFDSNKQCWKSSIKCLVLVLALNWFLTLHLIKSFTLFNLCFTLALTVQHKNWRWPWRWYQTITTQHILKFSCHYTKLTMLAYFYCFNFEN